MSTYNASVKPPNPPCHCGLFHSPNNHMRPRTDFVKSYRCIACPTLRCDRTVDCRFPHAQEDKYDHAYRMRHNVFAPGLVPDPLFKVRKVKGKTVEDDEDEEGAQ